MAMVLTDIYSTYVTAMEFNITALSLFGQFGRVGQSSAPSVHPTEECTERITLLMRSIFIPKMRMLIHDYVTSCLACQLSKPSRQLSYGELKSIPYSDEPLAELSLDFIAGFLMSTNDNNAILTVTNRFSKYAKALPGKETLSEEDWGSLYWKHVFKEQGTVIPPRPFCRRNGSK